MRQTTRVVLVSLLLALISVPLTAAAQGTNQVYRIGWLWGGRFSTQAHRILQGELRARGWIEGQKHFVRAPHRRGAQRSSARARGGVGRSGR